MMRTIRRTLWFLPVLTVIVLSMEAAVYAQDSSSAAPGQNTNAPQVAQPPGGGVNWKGVGIGAGTVVSNLVYVPAKVAYGILGGIAGGAGYALTGGNKQVADSIWRSSLGGDYVLTPDMVSGKKPIYFSGPSEPGPSQSMGAVSPPPNPTPNASTASSSPAPSYGNPSATHPIDAGAGPVGPTTAPYNPSAASGNSSPATSKSSPLPDSSIE
jgi:hypothetical protein